MKKSVQSLNDGIKIKTQLWKYVTANGTHRYIDILQALVDRYNSTKHRSIGCIPSDARKPSNHQQVFRNLLKSSRTSS